MEIQINLSLLEKAKRNSLSSIPTPTKRKDRDIDQAADMLRGKTSKAKANYRPAPLDSPKSCSTCSYYRNLKDSQSTCQRVAGLVEANDICDYYDD